MFGKSSNPFCTKVGIQKRYGWPAEGLHKCYNIDCSNVIDCNPLNGALCPECHPKYQCQCFECFSKKPKLQIQHIGLPTRSAIWPTMDVPLPDNRISFKDPLHIVPDSGSHEIRPYGMQKIMPIILKDNDVEKLLMSDIEKSSRKDETEQIFKQFQKTRTKAKNPNNRSKSKK